MIKNVNFLCEIGTEEIPAGYIPPAINSIKKIFSDDLTEKRINFDEIEVYATPRRLVLVAANLASKQREEEIELKGPAAKAAYDGDGKPTKALQGFMKGNKINEKDVAVKDTEKGEYIFATKKLESQNTEEIIPLTIEKIIKTLSFPKKMKWSDKDVTFPRPITYFLILFNDSLIPFEIDGIVSSNKTRGHYIQHNELIEIDSVKNYEEILKKNGVILNQVARKEFINTELKKTADKLGLILHEDEELLDTVTYLVENPHIVVCDFDKDVLNIPDIVLIAEMKEHQKYFSLKDKDGNLVNKFIVVSNNPATDFIKAGNERVIAARFNDARFFYDEDRKIKLADRVESLKNVLFHKELGSIYDKIERLKKIAEVLSDSLGIEENQKKDAQRAATLCKVDLVTQMVIEFSSLQGKVGRIYALHDGENENVANAIEEHYKPKFQGDNVPTNIVSVIVSLAEKIDNVFGSFSVGNIPKGSHDPYALRRQSNAIVEMLIKNTLNISLDKVLNAVSDNYKNGKEIISDILQFVSARAKTIYTDNGFSHDEVDACLSTGRYDYYELFRIADSINEFRKKDAFSEMLLGFKRMNNIVNAFRKDNGDYDLTFNPSLLEDNAEKELHSFFDSRIEIINSHISEGNYIQLYELLIEGKTIIDTFFDKVLVMDKKVELRDNRLFILESILENFTNLIDFSRLEDKTG